MPLARPRWEADGMWRGDRTGFDASVYPSFQPNAVAPALGAAIESAGVTWLHGRLSYRRVYNTGTSNVSQFVSGLNQPVPTTARASRKRPRLLARSRSRERRQRARRACLRSLHGAHEQHLRLVGHLLHTPAHGQPRLRLFRADVRRRQASGISSPAIR